MNTGRLTSKLWYIVFALILLLFGACKKNDLNTTPTTTETISSPSALAAIIVSDTSAILHWSPVSEAVSYNLYFATDSNFANPFSGYNPKSVTDTSAILTNLSPGATYYYKVEAVNGTGNTSKSSSAISLTTLSTSADEYVIVGSDDGKLYCYNALTGSAIWTFKITNAFESTPTVNTGTVYIGGNDSSFYAIDVNTGIEKWQKYVGGSIATCALVNNGVVYFGSLTGFLYALNANSGSEIWIDNFNPTGSVNNSIVSSPTLSNGQMILIGCKSDGILRSIFSSSGVVDWNAVVGNSFESSVAISNEIIYAGGGDGTLYAINVNPVSFKWTYTAGSHIASCPTVNNGIVYVGSENYNLYAIDAVTGAVKWTYTTGDTVFSSPIVSNGVVYVGSNDDKLYAIDAATGTLKWSALTDGAIKSSPVVSNGIVYVGSDDQNLYAFDATTGRQKWHVLTGGKVFSSPCIVTYNGNVIQSGVSGDTE
jgi:eukaryotic-like serine/threonine-protein kinase